MTFRNIRSWHILMRDYSKESAYKQANRLACKQANRLAWDKPETLLSYATFPMKYGGFVGILYFCL